MTSTNTLFLLGALLCCNLLPSSHALVLKDRPVLKYGTAWKKEDTAKFVHQAIKAGFRHIDTACQPRHYREDLVGEGWKAAAKELNLKREDLWLQTKFSGLGAHSADNIPYDKDAPLETRVRQSLAKSLHNLQTHYLDSWLMHGPENNWDDHFEVWRTMEKAVDEGKVIQIGLSNFYRLEDVVWAYDHSRIKPKVLQNRFYLESGHDVEIRAFCKEKDIEYQSFWTLTANGDAYRHPKALELAKEKGLSPEELFYAFCMALGISPMDGSTNEVHMKEDIALMNRIRSGEKIFLDSSEMSIIGNALGTSNWNTILEEEDEL
eukprot:CAMPEP_0201687210 /NCGR_PEP_ID=MMETSP0578-20130828/1366_1 /ASSEMBLY_ACC=CAM_ASM_000663 /TAXON_ID=267565 /ORGANISM="Skeletonema grethea, Strain CCMP 1804" /LENGTH=319 /DNA_ID=CAMNT_0048171343 /DNA_START=66 /DNA_END=1025 /DNA_ORIENTATION=+